MISIKPLPFTPESLEAALGRFGEACREAVTAAQMLEDVKSGMLRVNQRKHVFDLDDGLRMIALRETMPGAPELLHFTFARVFAPHAPVDVSFQNRASELAGKFLLLRYDPVMPFRIQHMDNPTCIQMWFPISEAKT